MRDISLLKHSEAVSTFVDFLTRNLNRIIVKGQKGEPIAIETLGGFILSGFFIDENSNKTIEDNFINNYKEEKRVYLFIKVN